VRVLVNGSRRRISGLIILAAAVWLAGATIAALTGVTA
jgi:hypothetical protein